ncbi:hypothetical protein GCM10009745_31350 [Kribbella yunnanensis]|uniref:WXG100 family type VII secretion target n=1 Tax=Kribbella yunnanensis TaxID=190194 RepID=A0ABP4T9W8_9ACTN
MTTPQQEATGQNSAREYFESLNEADQLAMRRAMNVFRALAPIYDAVNRTVEFTRRTSHRLSEGAQSLVSQTQQYGREAADWASRTGTNLVDRAADLRDRAGVAAEVAATRVGEGLDTAGQVISNRATATRDAVVSGAGTARNAVVSGAGTARNAVVSGAGTARNAVVSGAGTAREAVVSGAGSARDAVVSGAGNVRDAAVDAGQRAAALAGRASRWFQEKVSNTAARAAAGYHAVKEFNDPGLNNEAAPTPGGPEVSAQAITAVSAQVLAYVQAQSQEQQQSALQQLAELNARGETMSATDQAIFNAALSGNAPAAGAVTTPQQQTPDGRGPQNQPEKGPDLGK